ncbi:MAG: NAD-dependent isocitrate dehydrogenase [Candidatus Thermoplasmatota archaeon]|nr:NAD-dependent isocitrate dehydrogenase [Candidatus Thermoplasmatota archaeon]
MKSICVLPGDGIGPEVVGCATRVLERVTDELELHMADIGRAAFRRSGEHLPTDTLAAMEASDSSLFGAVTSDEGTGYDSPVLRFRKELELFANLRPVKNIAQVSTAAMDLLIVRENTEGLYTMDEHEDDAGVTTRRRVSKYACKKIVEKAIDEARRTGRKGVCCVHKANVLRKSDGLFLQVFRDIARTHGQGLTFSDQLVDSAAAKLVTRPDAFDVIVTLNLYGDILSDLAAGVVGGLGFAPSGNMGDRQSVFEPAHGSAPDIAGKGIANPTAAILAAAMMIEHLGMTEEAAVIASAVSETYRAGDSTMDVGGNLGSHAFTEAVIKHVVKIERG